MPPRARQPVPQASPKQPARKARSRPPPVPQDSPSKPPPVPQASPVNPAPRARSKPPPVPQASPEQPGLKASSKPPPVPQVSPASPAPEPRDDPRARRIARKSKRQDNRRQVILAGAREVLLAHGPVAFTMERLASALATSKAGLYYYFRSREELVAALALAILRREALVLSRVVVAADTGLAGLAALLRARVEHHLADRDGFRILYLWAPVLGDPRLLAEVHLLSAVVHTTLTARLLRDHRSGLLRPELDPRRLPDLAWSLAQGLLVRIVSDPALPWRELLNDACTALIRGAQDPSAIRHS